MRVLFLTSEEQDILEDSMLHGLRGLLGPQCVDYPRKDVLYKDYKIPFGTQPYGNLFTLWKTLDEISVDREDVENRLRAGDFDVVVLGSVHRVLGRYLRLMDALAKSQTIALDGEDYPALAIHALRFLYFKRELYWKANLLWHGPTRPRRLRFPVVTWPLRIESISFSIPSTKIVRAPLPAAKRERAFSGHIVDPELRKYVASDSTGARQSSSSRGYPFASEAEYYRDLQTSLCGVTTKRGGWDCLRHYEIAANGAILCFRELDRKPRRCAPAGLSRTNALIYGKAAALLKQVQRLTTGEKDALIEASHLWAAGQTTERRARDVLDVARRRFGQR